MLAGELSKSPGNIPHALSQYEQVARPFVERVQKLVPGAPQIANPQTEWGITLFNTMTGILAHPFAKKFGKIVGGWIPAFGPTTAWTPPDYGMAEI